MAREELVYSVTATLGSAEAREEYLRWLEGGHAAALLAWARAAEVVCLEGAEGAAGGEGGWRVESRYVFEGREALERYLREGAPALRAEGAALAARLGGVSFERRVGVRRWRGGAGAGG
ncbi:MAG: DUF4286 family protein [Deltaproteobacteria bacterium]|nr:DUF4286 family protein [Deltaproteobacteria bacterium]